LAKMELTWQWYEGFSYCCEARKMGLYIDSLQISNSSSS
jgi:hypothetical protein